MSIQTKQTIACEDCSAMFRIEDIGPLPRTLALCPACGSSHIVVSRDGASDLFESIGQTRNLPPFIVRLLYDEWLKAEGGNFKDFIDQTLKEATNDNN